jgi:septal ring factor EnvC (AmiA/AmiB activator)
MLEQISVLEKGVAKKNLEVRDLTEKVGRIARQNRELQDKLIDLERLLRNSEMRLANRVVRLYKYARTGYMRILAGSTDLDQFRKRLKYVRIIMAEDEKTLGKLLEEKRGYRTQVLKTKISLSDIQALEKNERLKLSTLKNDIEKKVIRLIKIRKEKEFYATAVKELESGAEVLKQTISDLGSKKSEKIVQHSSFADSKGLLPFPLEGKTFKGDKFLGGSAGHLHSGIFIEGSDAKEVKAVFPGRVDFSGFVKGYGELTIINHGSRYFSLYANLSQREKKKGDYVKREEVLGVAAGDRSSKKPWIYFEIRRGHGALNPLKWLKSK